MTRETLGAAGGKLLQMHTSGHAFVDDLKTLIRKINPGQIIPIHTFGPRALKEHFPGVVTTEDGQSIDV